MEDVFGDLINEHGEPGLLLKGLRHREGLSQIELAIIRKSLRDVIYKAVQTHK